MGDSKAKQHTCDSWGVVKPRSSKYIKWGWSNFAVDELLGKLEPSQVLSREVNPSLKQPANQLVKFTLLAVVESYMEYWEISSPASFESEQTQTAWSQTRVSFDQFIAGSRISLFSRILEKKRDLGVIW